MRTKPLLILLGLLLAVGSPCQAQDYPERQEFQDSAGGLSILFRGKQARKYLFRANGHLFWQTPDFQKGDIMFEGRLYRGILMNIDAVSQEPLVKMEGNVINIALQPSLVEWLTMGDKRFVNLRALGRDDLPKGFFEVLYEGGVTFYKRVDKRVNSNINNVNGSQIGYEDPDYINGITTYFEYLPSYYLQDKDGRITRIRNKAAFRRAFPELKREMRRFAGAGGMNTSDVNLGEYGTVLLKHFEQ